LQVGVLEEIFYFDFMDILTCELPADY